MFFRLFCLDNVKPYIVYLYLWYFIFNKLYVFIPGNIFVYCYSKKFNKRFTFIGNLNEILSRALCLWKNRYLAFPALRDKPYTTITYKTLINIT